MKVLFAAALYLFSPVSFISKFHLFGRIIMPSERICFTASLAARCGHVTKFCLVRYKKKCSGCPGRLLKESALFLGMRGRVFPLLLFVAWNAAKLTGAPVAVLYLEETLRVETRSRRAE